MSKVKYNRANISLCIALAIFILSLFLNKIYPESTVVNIIMFISEAAMVGGLADWFAVTALFENPFRLIKKDIPCTAIIPKARKDLANKAGAFIHNIITKEFVLDYINNINLMQLLLNLLKSKENQRGIILYLLNKLKESLGAMQADFNIRELSNLTRSELLEYKTDYIVNKCLIWIKSGTNLVDFMEYISPFICEKISSNDFLKLLKDNYSDLEKENINNSLLEWALKSTNLLNINDAAETTQLELINFIKELGERGSETQKKILNILIDKADTIPADREIMILLNDFRKQIIKCIPFEEVYKGLLSKISQEIKDEELYDNLFSDKNESFSYHTEELLYINIDLLLKKLEIDIALNNDVESFIKQVGNDIANNVDLIKVINVIVKKAIKNMSDEQLIQVIRSKVEEDLIFIRYNGAVVGGGIGAFLSLINLFV